MSVQVHIPPPPEPEQPSVEPEEESFDPGDHTIDEVKEYVTAHAEEVEAVLEAESAGKNRVTLVDWLEEQEIPPEEDT